MKATWILVAITVLFGVHFVWANERKAFELGDDFNLDRQIRSADYGGDGAAGATIAGMSVFVQWLRKKITFRK